MSRKILVLSALPIGADLKNELQSHNKSVEILFDSLSFDVSYCNEFGYSDSIIIIGQNDSNLESNILKCISNIRLHNKDVIISLVDYSWNNDETLVLEKEFNVNLLPSAGGIRYVVNNVASINFNYGSLAIGKANTNNYLKLGGDNLTEIGLAIENIQQESSVNFEEYDEMENELSSKMQSEFIKYSRILYLKEYTKFKNDKKTRAYGLGLDGNGLTMAQMYNEVNRNPLSNLGHKILLEFWKDKNIEEELSNLL